MARAKSDDEIFKAAKNKIGTMIGEAKTVDDAVKLVNALTKMKAVELKMSEGEWGSGLGGGGDSESGGE